MTLGVGVDKRKAEDAIALLRRANLIDSSLKIKRKENMVLIPVRDPYRALQSLATMGIDAIIVDEAFEPALEKPKPLSAILQRISGYNLIGDIVVFNWRSDITIEEYRRAASELLRMQPRIKAAYLKTETYGEYRAQRLLHLAGENRTETIHKEYGLLFHVDIAKVYFNPRLSSEHRRIAEEAARGETILDLFAGVGGYAIHIASMRETRVVASDLNEHAVYYLARNVKTNMKNLKGSVTPLRLDASLSVNILKPIFDRIILDHPTESQRYAREACLLASSNTIIHVYTRASTCREAVENIAASLSPCCRRVDELYCREVLEYSPGVSIFNATFIVSGSKT